MDHHYELLTENQIEPKKIRKAQEIINRFRDYLKNGGLWGGELPEFELRWIKISSREAFEIDRILQKWAGTGQEKYLCELADIGGMFIAKLWSGKKIIYLRADLSIIDLGRTLIHELSHLYRFGYHGSSAHQILEDLAALDEERLAGLIEGGSCGKNVS